jgi:uncharacterized protein (DUF1330 family)
MRLLESTIHEGTIMPAYWIGRALTRDPEGYRRYAELARPALAGHAHRVLARGGRSEVLEGALHYDRHVILEFASVQAALDCYHSAAYQRAALIRQQASEDCQLVIVEGV